MKREERIVVKVSKREKKTLQELAEKARLSLAGYIRNKLLGKE
ncbi:MAG: hypothetical protein QME47_06010 [Candidatus Thermoplasmatota archaeon]|nr:hypothetical protein [Candidatus Thermoplasmatota archaeon]